MNKMESKNNPKPISKNNYIIIQIAAFISVYKQNMKGVVRLQFWLDHILDVMQMALALLSIE